MSEPVTRNPDMRFILWDPRGDGPEPRRDSDGNIISDGLIGRVGPDNCYIEIYGEYPKGSKSVLDLEVGEAIRGVKFGLSGTSGHYDVWRVR